MFAKLKSDGTIQNAPNPLRIVVANPTPEVYEQWGYHEVTETTPPEYDATKQKIASHYEMQDGKIVQVWEVTDLPNEDSADASPAEGTENAPGKLLTPMPMLKKLPPVSLTPIPLLPNPKIPLQNNAGGETACIFSLNSIAMHRARTICTTAILPLT